MTWGRCQVFASRLAQAIAVAVALILVGVAVALDPVVAREIALALAIIVIPGAVVSRSLFHGSALGWADIALLTLSFGIAILTLGGLLLNLLPGGLTFPAWVVYVVGVTVAGIAVLGIQRRARTAEIVRQRLMAHAVPARPRSRIRSKDVVLIAVALGVGSLALGIAGVAAVTEPTPAFSELWLVPNADGSRNVEVGVRSSEHATRRNVVELRSGPTLVGRWDFRLDPGATWRMSVPIASPPTFDRPLEARLILPGISDPYRSVVLRDQSPG
jgi:uncharacterized membrane protein